MMCWVDIETTCLDPDKIEAFPLEISVVITDDDLRIVPDQNRTHVLYYDYDTCLTLFGHLNDNVVKMHTENGLWDDCKEANTTAREADILISEWIDSLDYEPMPLAGSTISFDRAWLKAFFPNFHSRLHYRNIDTSTVKELTKRWNPPIHEHYKETAPKVKEHRSLGDIMESIREMTLYKDHLFDVVQELYDTHKGIGNYRMCDRHDG